MTTRGITDDTTTYGVSELPQHSTPKDQNDYISQAPEASPINHWLDIFAFKEWNTSQLSSFKGPFASSTFNTKQLRTMRKAQNHAQKPGMFYFSPVPT